MAKQRKEKKDVCLFVCVGGQHWEMEIHLKEKEEKKRVKSTF